MVRPMATAVTTPSERPVFVAADDRRARRLRCAAALGVALSGAWLIALAVGMLGVGRLPDLSLPLIARGADKAPAAADRVVSESSAVATSIAAERAASAKRFAAAAASGAAIKAGGTKNAVASAHTTTAKKAHPAKPQRKTPQQTVPSASPATTVTATARQGWARRGLTEPPGRVRQPEPKAKAAAAPARTRRNATDTTTAPATPVTTPVPPGQQKKADDPKQES
jgi:hypothetical protein